MSTGQFTNNGITVRVSGTSHQGAADRLQLVPARPAPTTPGLALVPSPAAVGRTCKALFGAARCGEPTEEGEGNPDGYCTHHLDLMAGDQEDWESDQEYARRRRQLCPYQTGSGMPWIEWCPEPSHPESDDGFCLIHEPTLNPDELAYDAEAALPYLDDSVPCLQCRGVEGCEMCGGTGRITLRRANWHRGDDALLPDPTQGATMTTDRTADNTQPAPADAEPLTYDNQGRLDDPYHLLDQPRPRVPVGLPHEREAQREVDGARKAWQRRAEVIAAADKLDPADTSDTAELLREVAESARDHAAMDARRIAWAAAALQADPTLADRLPPAIVDAAHHLVVPDPISQPPVQAPEANA